MTEKVPTAEERGGESLLFTAVSYRKRAETAPAAEEKGGHDLP